jgi:inosine-uridine nucleoside N-ribohydrolase
MKEWNYAFEVPDVKRVRMLVYTDCKNEADDQFALAHHLMTPRFIVKGIIGGHFNANPQEWGHGHTAGASVDEVNKILSFMELEGEYPVLTGSEYPLKDECTPCPSPGAKFIIEEAMKEDEHPLFIACLGSLTDLASAILLEPEICKRMTAIWIGGGRYPEGGWEFNLFQDVVAANIVMKSDMSLWQIPVNAYKQMAVSIAELQLRVRSFGEIGAYLFEQMVAYNKKCIAYPSWPHGEIWTLGDSPTVGVLLEEVDRKDLYEEISAPTIEYESMKYNFENGNRRIRVYHHIDVRLTMEDFYAKLALNYPNNK